MTAYLITGRGGSGKSTIAKALRRRGYPAFDGDEVPGLTRWEDVYTYQPVEVDASGYIDFSKVAWNWQNDAFEKLLATHDPLFLCGSASNQRLFHPRFDKIFMLTLDPGTQRKRLESRRSGYGKHPLLLSELLARQQALAKEMLALGAVGIDATQPVDNAVDEVLRHVNLD